MGFILPQTSVASAFPGLLRDDAALRPSLSVEFPTRHGTASVVGSYRELNAAFWQRTMEKECMDRRYYELAEETLQSGFEYRYLILTNSSTGAVAIQPIFLISQDITAGVSGPLRSLVGRVRQRFPGFLSMKIAMIGCSAGTGRLDCPEPWVEALAEAMDGFAKVAKASVIVFKEFPSAYRGLFEKLSGRGYRRAPSMPGAEMALDYSSFEEFMEKKLSYNYRKNLRRKFRDTERNGGVTMEVTSDVTPYVDEVHPLYLQTYERSELKFEKLTKQYLCELGRRMPERTRFFLWRHNGKIVAFSVCLIHEDTLHDLNLGMDYSVALSLNMYFISWRDIVQWAIDAKLSRYYTGSLNYDPKLHFRLQLAPLDLYARHSSALFNPLFGFAMGILQPARYNSILKRFANAHEI